VILVKDSKGKGVRGKTPKIFCISSEDNSTIDLRLNTN